MSAPYGQPQQSEPRIARLLAPNPSAFTFTGTQTHLVGTRDLAVIDPGPGEPAHLDAIVDAIAGRSVSAIVVTQNNSRALIDGCEFFGSGWSGIKTGCARTVGPSTCRAVGT